MKSSKAKSRKSDQDRDLGLLLLNEAAKTSKNAYAPYSKFHVGAALLTDKGEIVTGCNVENASYGLTICAERNAVFASVAMQRRKFVAVAITASGKAVPYPCGACRQVLAEFCSPDTPVFVASTKNLKNYDVIPLGHLLPKSFKF